jgi:ComF family protein
MGMLAPILDFLFPPKDTARVVAQMSELEFGRLLSPTVLPSGVVGLLPYRHSLVRAAIIEAKFHRNPKALSLLSMVLADYLQATMEDAAPFETPTRVVVPIPLSQRRKRDRGYNQVEELLQHAHVPYDAKLLTRIRDTTPQTSLPRKARLQNMRGAFSAIDALDPHTTVIILDDVCTTGATLESARSAFYEKGVLHVELLSLAH